MYIILYIYIMDEYNMFTHLCAPIVLPLFHIATMPHPATSEDFFRSFIEDPFLFGQVWQELGRRNPWNLSVYHAVLLKGGC